MTHAIRWNNERWMALIALALLLTLLLAACGSSEEAADAPQEEPATAVETEAEQAAAGAAVCVVPGVVGFDQANAERMVQGVGLVPVRSAEFSAEVPEGHVIAQEPAGDTRLDPCAGDVSLVVSLGAGEVATGETPAGAEDTPETTMPVSTASGRAPITPDNAASVMNIATLTLEGHMDGAKYVTFSPDGTLLASSGGCDEGDEYRCIAGTVKLWDVTTSAETATLNGHSDLVLGVAFSPNGMVLASASQDGTVKLWEVDTGSEIATLEGHTNWVLDVAFSPDGALLASSGCDEVDEEKNYRCIAGTVKLWNVTTGAETATLKGYTNSVLDVAFSPDGALLASGSGDGTVKLWDVDTGTEITTLKEHTNSVLDVAFSPDGALLASGSGDGTVKLWDVDTGIEIATLEGYTDRVRSVAFSPGGALLASGSGDGMVKLWDVTTRVEIATLNGHTYGVNGVAFSPDGILLASASNDGMKIWAVPTEAEVATIKRTREAIVGKWAGGRYMDDEIEREAGRPDYDYVFFPDGTMVSFEGWMPSGVHKYELIDSKWLQIEFSEDAETIVNLVIEGDRMTWMVDDTYEIGLERVGSIDMAAIERIREHTREVVAGKWFLELDPDQVDDDMSFAFYPDGTLQVISRDGRYNGSYDIVDETYMYIAFMDENDNVDSMLMRFSLSGNQMTWVMMYDMEQLELERIGPVD